MAVSKVCLSVLLSLNLVDTVLSYAECGFTTCSGYSAYCCSYDSDLCCYEYVYHFWWFWFIWVLIFTLIASCSLCCYRRRRRYIRTDYSVPVVTEGYRPPAYGTVVTVGAPPPYPPQQAATAPPQYQPEQKPPAYIP